MSHAENPLPDLLEIELDELAASEESTVDESSGDSVAEDVDSAASLESCALVVVLDESERRVAK